MKLNHFSDTFGYIFPFRRHIVLYMTGTETYRVGTALLWTNEKKWDKAHGIYYEFNTDTRGINIHSLAIWVSQNIQGLIEMSLELWRMMNKLLHGILPEEERIIERIKVIQIVTKKYAKGLRVV